jgi:hypothetical protein
MNMGINTSIVAIKPAPCTSVRSLHNHIGSDAIHGVRVYTALPMPQFAFPSLIPISALQFNDQ